jgi:glycosyltransferase involved in cell wall biosynthesis
VSQSSAPDTMQPDIAVDGEPPTDLAAHLARRSHQGTVEADPPSIVQQMPTRPHHVDARASGALARVPTIVAIGPFDDREHAQQLATAFITVRGQCKAKLLLLGSGAQRVAVIRETSERAIGTSAHLTSDSCDDRWSEVVAGADVVVLGSSSGLSTLLEVMAAGRAVVAPANPATVQLVVPAIAGLVYRQGDLPAMTAALLRLLTDPALRRGMGGRAINVARRHRLEVAAADDAHGTNQAQSRTPVRRYR